MTTSCILKLNPQPVTFKTGDIFHPRPYVRFVWGHQIPVTSYRNCLVVCPQNEAREKMRPYAPEGFQLAKRGGEWYWVKETTNGIR